MNETDTALDKLQVATFRLADTICGYFSGDHPITTISGAKSVDTVVRDLRKFYVDKKLIPPLRLLSDEVQNERSLAYFSRQMRLLYNFSKHSDRKNDTSKEAVYSPLYAMLALNSTCVDLDNLTGELLENDLADLYTFYEYPMGGGTRIMVLSQILKTFVKRHIERKEINIQEQEEGKSLVTLSPALPSLKQKQSVYNVIEKYDLRESQNYGSDLHLKIEKGRFPILHLDPNDAF